MKRILGLMKPDSSRRSEISHKIMRLLIVLGCLALVIPSLSCFHRSSLELKLDKAPHLNEAVTLTCIRQTKASDNGTHEKITVEFERIDPKTSCVIKVPVQEVLVNGNLNWEGDMTGEPIEFSSNIKFTDEGNWRICAYSEYSYFDSDCVFLNIAEDSSSFGWPDDYRPYTGHSFPVTPSERYPITVELDMPKPPLLDEPVQLTWSINSIKDISEASGKVEFYRMEGTDRIEIPVEEVIVDGNLSWEGSLTKDNPLHFSATVKLPEDGDWEIRTTGSYYAQDMFIEGNSFLYLNVGKDKSRWGWTQLHEKPSNAPLPPVNINSE